MSRAKVQIKRDLELLRKEPRAYWVHAFSNEKDGKVPESLSR
jgi:hypothetical protein